MPVNLLAKFIGFLGGSYGAFEYFFTLLKTGCSFGA